MAKRIDIQDGITLMLINRMKSTFYINDFYGIMKQEVKEMVKMEKGGAGGK